MYHVSVLGLPLKMPDRVAYTTEFIFSQCWSLEVQGQSVTWQIWCVLRPLPLAAGGHLPAVSSHGLSPVPAHPRGLSVTYFLS